MEKLLNNAKNQLENISIEQIKKILQKNFASEYEKMIVDPVSKILRADFYYANMLYKNATRNHYTLKFPLFDEIKSKYELYEGGIDKFGDKSNIDDEGIINEFENINGLIKNKNPNNDTSTIFDKPFDITDDSINDLQKNYFLAKHTYKKVCSKCEGTQYITCTDPDCKGQHVYKCPDCKGAGEIKCPDCKGKGEVKCPDCKGKGEVKCPKCNGKGTIPKLIEQKEKCTKCNGKGKIEKEVKKSKPCAGCHGTGRLGPGVPGSIEYKNRSKHCHQCHGTGTFRWTEKVKEKCTKCGGKGTITKQVKTTEKCLSCRGTGKVSCTTCHSTGIVSCKTCNSTGKLICKTCDGKGEITCQYCYGDSERYGKIDCPECLATGIIANFEYVETLIKDKQIQTINYIGDDIEVNENIISTHINKDIEHITAYKNINGNISGEIDDISKEFIASFENEINLSKSDFPMLLQEDIYYQVIPIVSLEYRHILTNTTHFLKIVNIWENPQLILDTGEEVFIEDSSKTDHDLEKDGIINKLIYVFSNVFQTKAYKEKQDLKTTIKLMIHVAKSDGKVNEKSKEIINNNSKNFDSLSSFDQQELLNILNTRTLPNLTQSDMVFSSSQKKDEILLSLGELVEPDAEPSIAKKQIIETIKKLPDAQRKKTALLWEALKQVSNS